MNELKSLDDIKLSDLQYPVNYDAAKACRKFAWTKYKKNLKKRNQEKCEDIKDCIDLSIQYWQNVIMEYSVWMKYWGEKNESL